MALVYGNNLPVLVATRLKETAAAATAAADRAEAAILREAAARVMTRGAALFRVPVGCHAFGASGNATRGAAGAMMGRDFMLPSGGVFQELAAHVIRSPTDGGRQTTLSVGAPGFVGSITVLNSDGVAMGVDVVRSGLSNPERPGFNSLLLVRDVGDRATDTAGATQIVVDAQRGVTWLYPVCDAKGICTVLEAAMVITDNEFSPRASVQDERILKVLPSDEWLQAHPGTGLTYKRGVWSRGMDYIYPTAGEMAPFNEALFAVDKVPFNASAFADTTGRVFPTFEAETRTLKHIYNNYFPPQRETRSDIVLCSNNAVVPAFRVTSMADAPNLIVSLDPTAPQWRYDRLNELVLAAVDATGPGITDIGKAWDIITFMSPARTPGFSKRKPVVPSDPLSILIEGAVSAIDTGGLIMRSQWGYWSDDTTQMSLQGGYLSG
jgi:hypothetical protein